MLKDLARALTPPLIWRAASELAKFPARIEEPPELLNRDLFYTFNKLNEGCSERSIVLRNDVALRLHPGSRIPFEYFCYRDRDMVEEFDCFLEHSAGCRRLLDVGALHGIFSLVFALGDTSRSAIAIDPSPFAFSKLLYNVRANALEHRIACAECALSDASGEIQMQYFWEHAVTSFAATNGSCFSAVMWRGDELCEREAFEPDLIKIDVEGQEVRVVRGLLSVITRNHPLIFLEIHPDAMKAENSRPRDIFELLTMRGYKAFDMKMREMTFDTIEMQTSVHRLLYKPI